MSPPKSARPQVTTDPSVRIAAKALSEALDLLHAFQLILDSTTVATIELAPLRNNRSIAQDGCKSTGGGCDLLHACQLILHSASVATKVCAAPGNNRSVGQDSCKSTFGGLDLDAP